MKTTTNEVNQEIVSLVYAMRVIKDMAYGDYNNRQESMQLGVSLEDLAHRKFEALNGFDVCTSDLVCLCSQSEFFPEPV